jgi:hypothetical protein
VFHDTLRPSDKAGWFAAAYFVLSLLQAQLQAFWHWVEESPLPVGAVATTDCITFLMQLKQRNPSLGKIPPALIAALAWVHPHVQIVSTWGKSATEVLRTQLKSAVRSIKQSQLAHLLLLLQPQLHPCHQLIRRPLLRRTDRPAHF